MATQNKTVKVVMMDTTAVHQDPRLEDFLAQMAPLKAALRETERIVGSRAPSLYFRIKKVQKNSPLDLELEAVSEEPAVQARPKYASRIVRVFGNNLGIIANRHELPTGLDYLALESYRNLVIKSDKIPLTTIISVGTVKTALDENLRDTIDTIAGDDEISYGSISGRFEAINLHSDRPRFTIFPTIGPLKVRGTFKKIDRAEFSKAVDKYVTVYGKMRYKKWDRFAYSINADSIEIHDIGPGLASLRGIAPQATGNLSSVDYIRRIRNEW